MKIITILILVFLTSCRLTSAVWKYSYLEKISGYNENKDPKKIILVGRKNRYEFEPVEDDVIKLLAQKTKLPNDVMVIGRAQVREENKINLIMGFTSNSRLSEAELEVIKQEINKPEFMNLIKNSIEGVRYVGSQRGIRTHLFSDPYIICFEYKKSFTGFAKRVALTPLSIVFDILADVGDFIDIPNWKKNFVGTERTKFFTPFSCGIINE